MQIIDVTTLHDDERIVIVQPDDLSSVLFRGPLSEASKLFPAEISLYAGTLPEACSSSGSAPHAESLSPADLASL